MFQKILCLIFHYRILFTWQNNDEPLLESKETIHFAFGSKCLWNAFWQKCLNINPLYSLGQKSQLLSKFWRMMITTHQCVKKCYEKQMSCSSWTILILSGWLVSARQKISCWSWSSLSWDLSTSSCKKTSMYTYWILTFYRHCLLAWGSLYLFWERYNFIICPFFCFVQTVIPDCIWFGSKCLLVAMMLKMPLFSGKAHVPCSNRCSIFFLLRSRQFFFYWALQLKHLDLQWALLSNQKCKVHNAQRSQFWTW